MEEIKVYVAEIAPLADEARFARLFASVRPERQEEILKKKRAQDRYLSLGAELLLKWALHEMGIDSYAVKKDENGKPHLLCDRSLFFSLSHSGERVMCALSDRPVGCDVQWMDARVSLTVADRFFSTGERALIHAQKSETARRLAFFRIWTLRESFVKATGEGILKGRHSFSVLPAKDAVVTHGISRDLPSHFFELPSETDYRYAVCGEREEISPAIYVDFSRI